MSAVSTFFTHALAEQGHDTTLIIRGDSAADVDAILQNTFGLEPVSNYEVRLFSRFESAFVKTSANFYLNAARYISSHSQKNCRTVVVTRNTTFLPYLVLLRKLRNVVGIFEAHGYHGRGTLPGLPSRPPRASVRLARQYGYMERLFLNKMNGLVCITRTQKKLYLDDFVRIPTIFLPLGAPALGRSNNASNIQTDSYHHKKLCYAGRLTPHIDHQVLFRALGLLEDKSIRLEWIGLTPENFPVLENEIRENKLGERVTLRGWLSHQEMRQVLRDQMSAGMVAYKPTFRSAAITSPTKIFDYFAAGLAVIATRIPTVEDIIEDGKNGLLFVPGDADSLAGAISALFRDVERYQELRKASLRSAHEYSWQNRAQKMMDFVDGL